MDASVERELRILESRTYALQVDSLEARVARLEQELAQLWANPGGGGCVIAFEFTVTDSSSHAAIAGATVDVLASDGLIAGTGVADKLREIRGAGRLRLVPLCGHRVRLHRDDRISFTATCGATVSTAVSLTAAGCSNTVSGHFLSVNATIATSSSIIPVITVGTLAMFGATITVYDNTAGATGLDRHDGRRGLLLGDLHRRQRRTPSPSRSRPRRTSRSP